MKDNSVSRFEWILCGGLVLAVAAFILGFTVVEYEQSRSKGISEYRQALEDNLSSPETRNLNQIRAGLRRWIAGYKELKVPTSYTEVYSKVDSALVTANTLAERFPTMSAPDFQRDLGYLQAKVHFLPPISSNLYDERNPWLSGYLLFVLIGFLKLVGVVLLAFVVFCGALYLADWQPKATPSASSAGTTSRGDGGWSGLREYPGVYEDTWRYPPPTYRSPPFW